MSRAEPWLRSPEVRPSGHFRRRTTLSDSPAQTRLVNSAVARAKEGDRDAVRFLYVHYADNVYGYVRSIVHDDYEAEDVTQHVFVKLLTVIGKYEQRAVPFSGWILRVAHNAAIDHMRLCRATPSPEIRPTEPITDEVSGERLYSISDALDTLPDDQRSVLVLRHVIGLSPGEIAERLGKSEASVHGLHHRARRTLQRELRDMGLAPATAELAVA